MAFYRNKRVLVAGGTGTIGIPLTKQLIEAGADVTVASTTQKNTRRECLVARCLYTLQTYRAKKNVVKSSKSKKLFSIL